MDRTVWIEGAIVMDGANKLEVEVPGPGVTDTVSIIERGIDPGSTETHLSQRMMGR